uniref:galactose-specific lectin nattectin-like n=1 Tax=Doryrhamphus excisus TaxID=161450 RepID=UPI0025AE687B|nr:galactose-specific lectin nattectin-like [Doryrhamphus excisus]
MAFANFFYFLCWISGLLTLIQLHPLLDDLHCPDEWTQVNDRCFIFKNDDRNFADAESICKHLGGNLASIHNGLENAALKELARDDNGTVRRSWIGLHDLATDPMWTDGTATDYEDYGREEPDGSGCTQFRFDAGEERWFDTSCDTEIGFICGKDVD